MDNRLASIFCCFPSFPVSRSRESLQSLAPEYSSPRDLPAYTGPELDPEKDAHFDSGLAVPRYLPVNLPADYSVNFLTLDPPAFEPPPYYPGLSKENSLAHTPKPKPLRLVRNSHKRKPPVFYAHNSKTVLQTTTYITIEPTSASSTAISTAPAVTTMSAAPTMPKPAPTLPSGPRPGGASPTKDEILADLRRQVSIHLVTWPLAYSAWSLCD